MAPHERRNPDDDEPSAEDLAEIERESGLISAELTLLDAEIRILCAEGDPSAVDWQRLRRAVRNVLRETAELYADEPPFPEEEAESTDQSAA